MDPALSPILLAALEQTFDSIVVTSAQAGPEGPTILYANAAFTRMTGFTAEEAIGRTPSILFGPSTDQRVLDDLRATLARGEVFFGATVAYRKDRTPFDVEWHVTPVMGPDGNVSHHFAIHRDVTEHNRAARVLLESEERFRAAAEGSLDGLLIARTMRDREGRVVDFEYVYANARSRELLGMAVTRIVGARKSQVFPASVLGGMLPKLSEVVESGRPLQEELELRSPGLKGRFFQYQATRLGDGVAVTFRDNTKSRTVQRQLELAQRLDSIGRLASGIAHDFNNVLSAITGFGTLVQDSLEPDHPLRADVEQILNASLRAGALTRQLLAFSRRQILEPRVIDVSEVLRGMLPLLQRLVGEHVDIRIEQAPRTSAVKVDPGQLEQVMMNLVVNARDAMPSGGSIQIEIAEVLLDEAFALTHPPTQPGAYVLLGVRDTGHGMTKEVLERVFEPFFTTKPPGLGTGLGLSTVYGIVKQSGGYIWMESEPGRGTSARVYLPATREALSPPAQRPPMRAQGGSETVLLVEDDPAVRAFVGRLLEREGYRVLSAANAGEALLLAERHLKELDLVLADVVLPYVSGPELVARLRRTRPELPVVFMSGYNDEAAQQARQVAGEAKLIEKPLAAPTLLTCLRQVLDARPRGDGGR